MNNFYFANNTIGDSAGTVKILVHDLTRPFIPVWDRFMFYGSKLAFEVILTAAAETIAAALKWYAAHVLQNPHMELSLRIPVQLIN